MCLIFGMEASLAPPFYRAPAACASVSRSGGATCDTLPPAGRSHAQSPRRTSTAEPTVTSRQVLASVTLGSLLGLFFALLTMHVTLRHWARIITTVAEVSPLRRDDTRALLEEFRTVGRITLSGTVVTGLVQGALAGLGFWMTGVPRPLFLGIAAAIASLVPAVGTLLVWVPAGLYLLAVGSPGAAVAELAWGALVVVGFSDYVIRPPLGGDRGMPAILTFLALFGGLQVLGLPGLIAGPVLMALAVAVLRLYAREVRGGRAS